MSRLLFTFSAALFVASCGTMGAPGDPPSVCWISPPENSDLYEQWLADYKKHGCERWEKR